MTIPHCERSPLQQLSSRPLSRSCNVSVPGWNKRGRQQRIAHTTRERYQSWQSAGWNHVVLHEDTIVGVFTLCVEPLTDWLSAPRHPVPFLRALATDPDWRGCGVGAFGIRSAIELAAPEPVWLDCVSDFLPGYYQQHGFHQIDRRDIRTDDGDYDVCLMCSSPVDG